MARGKKKGGKQRRGDSDDDEPPSQKPVEETTTVQSRKSRKEKRQQRKTKQQQRDDSDDDDDDLALLIGGKSQFAADSDDDDDDDDYGAVAPSKNKRRGGGGGKKKQQLQLLQDSSSSDEEEEKEPESEKEEEADLVDEDDDDDGSEVQQVSMMIADEPKKDKKKKKKKSKDEKKEKKKKDKKKKKTKDGSSNEEEEETSHRSNTEKEAPKKSKFALQMEAAMAKKEAEKDEKEKPPEPKESPKKEEKQEEKAPAQEEDENVVYGHGDAVWSDKSQAQIEAEKNADTEAILTHGPDGKKLSNKERKRLLKAKQAAERAAEYDATAAKASREGAQFACSQTAINEKDPQWENSLDVNIPSFSISAAGKILFKDASLTIGHGRKYGLVGPNGRGKSTLLKMIQSKDLKLPPRVDFLYVEQEVVADDTPAVEAVLRADAVRWNLLEEEQELMNAIDAGDESAEKIDRLQEVLNQLTQMNADASEAKARRILYGLGFSMEMQTKPTKMFSGGWRMRISLARALFIEPTLLMLDEPTNHLDLNAVIWLDEYLQKWKKTLLVVSHDQDFLNSVCQEILHIEDLKLISYKGNYDSFKKAEKIKFQQQVKAWEKQEKRLRELKKSGKFSKAQATENVKKSSKREPGARSNKKKNNAIAAGTETAETAELVKRPREYTVKLEFVEVPELTPPVMGVDRVHFRYSPKHPVIFERIDFGIDMSSRICIVGPNGAGKSTLLKLLTGELSPTKGEIKRNPRLRMGIYNQHFVDRLPMSKTPVEHLRERFNEETYQSVRNRLGKYGLQGHAHEVAMRDLSGGQKARVVFVELSLQRPHILLLDEPTNNLDIETIDALVDAINEFNGGIVVVTHDQRLIEECDCTLWVVEKQGVTEWAEGFDDYKDHILQEMEEAVQKEAAVRQKKLEAAATAKAEKVARLASKLKKK